jgi:glucosamine--fructose-6-phosphate aminotransferase (isomerizing)
MSTLHSEIMDQPQTFARLLDTEVERTVLLARELAARPIHYVVIAARGTSDNAARYAQYLFGALLGLPVALATPSLHTLYRAHVHFDDALVIGISQSGQSPDICSVVADAQQAGAPTIAITNMPDSPLARAASHTIALHAGLERSIAATKTYTAQLGALALLVLSIANDSAGLQSMRSLPQAIEQVLTLDARIRDVAAHLRDAAAAVTLGRGYNYATAWEIALKIKELTYLPTEPYSSADFQHGPIALVREGFPIIMAAPRGLVTDDLAALAQRLRDLGARQVILSDVPELLAFADEAVHLPVSVDERFSPITTIVAGQLLAFHLAHARGVDPDQPRTIRKVTETH